MTHIRKATHCDREAIYQVYLNAFARSESEDVATLAVNLLNEASSPETIALIAESDGRVAGHVGFSPLTVDNSPDWKGYILAPLGVQPEFQNQQVGTKLVEYGKHLLTECGVDLLFVYGDPEYYGRFGFRTDQASKYVAPYQLEYVFGWQAVLLNGVDSIETQRRLSCVESLRNPNLW
jgi:putative acetyltransferase